MMERQGGNKKRITAAVIAAVLIFAAVAGIASAVRATTSSTVAVVPVSDLNYGNYLEWQNSVSGKITTEAEQKAAFDQRQDAAVLWIRGIRQSLCSAALILFFFDPHYHPEFFGDGVIHAPEQDHSIFRSIRKAAIVEP